MKHMESPMNMFAQLAAAALVRRFGTSSHGEISAHRDGAASPCALRRERESGARNCLKATHRLVTATLSVAVVAVALWSGGAQAQSCNLATNGSFESPNIQTEPQRPGENTAFVNGYAVWRTTTYPIDGWQTVSGTVDFLRYYNNASHGAQSLDLFGTAAATFRQTFTGLVAGRQYSFSIDYSGHTTTQAAGLVQLGNGGALVTVASLRPAANSISHGTAGIPATPAYTVTWRTFQHTFTAAGTSATIQFVETGAGSTGLFIDNFVFAGVGPCETDLAITKNDGETTYTPGLDTTYNIVVANNGSAPVTGAQISDPLPTGITSATWTCGNAVGGATCGMASGTGAINTTANLPIGASVTYTLTVAIPGSYSGNLSNTATVTAPAGVTDTNLANNTASDTNTMEVPPTSTACSPRNVVQGSSFTFAPLPVTGTVAKTGTTGGWQPAPNDWATLGGNYTIQWNFSQPVPARWFQFTVVDIDASAGAQVTVSLGAGSTATVAQMIKVSGALVHNASGVISRAATPSTGQSGTFRFDSNGTITSLRLVSANIASNDNIAHPVFVRPSCLTVQKVSEGDTGSFTINLTNVAQADGTNVASTTLTTTAAGTPVSSPGYFSRAPGTAITLGEVVSAGWGIASAVCTDQNAGDTGNPTVISTFATPTLTIPADNVRPEADIVCRFNNGQLPTINLTKTTSLAAGGPFGFTLGNTTVASPAPVSTSASGDTVVVDGDPGAETAFRVSSLDADVTIDESTVPAGWVVDGATCTDAGGASVGSLASGRYTIPAASIAVGETFNCSFVNEPTVNLRIDKSADPATVQSGETVTYTIAVNNDGPGPGDGAIVADPPVTGVDCAAATLSCSASGGAVCPATLDVATFQGIGLTIPAFPAGGALQFAMTCTVTASGIP
jgi:uncharacterized repeat protein (TIGR01451 family)